MLCFRWSGAGLAWRFAGKREEPKEDGGTNERVAICPKALMSETPKVGAGPGVLARARRLFAVLGGLYVLLILLLVTPFFQTQ